MKCRELAVCVEYQLVMPAEEAGVNNKLPFEGKDATKQGNIRDQTEPVLKQSKYRRSIDGDYLENDKESETAKRKNAYAGNKFGALKELLQTRLPRGKLLMNISDMISNSVDQSKSNVGNIMAIVDTVWMPRLTDYLIARNLDPQEFQKMLRYMVLDKIMTKIMSEVDVVHTNSSDMLSSKSEFQSNHGHEELALHNSENEEVLSLSDSNSCVNDTYLEKIPLSNLRNVMKEMLWVQKANGWMVGMGLQWPHIDCNRGRAQAMKPLSEMLLPRDSLEKNLERYFGEMDRQFWDKVRNANPSCLTVKTGVDQVYTTRNFLDFVQKAFEEDINTLSFLTATTDGLHDTTLLRVQLSEQKWLQQQHLIQWDDLASQFNNSNLTRLEFY